MIAQKQMIMAVDDVKRGCWDEERDAEGVHIVS
jgi:hypothetical protein